MLLSNLPRTAGPADIFRFYNYPQKALDLQMLTFLRTPTLYTTGEAIAHFVTENAARRFQRASDGVVLSGRHVRAQLIPARSAIQMLQSTTAVNLQVQLIHLLINQGSGSNVLLRGLPPALYVSRLHEQLESGYALAPPLSIRPSRKASHLRSLFDLTPSINQEARRLQTARKNEVYALIRRRYNEGLGAVLEALEDESENYATLRANERDNDQANDGLVDDNAPAGSDLGSDSARFNSSLAPSKQDGIEGPDLRVQSPNSGPEDSPYAYTQPAKAFWDTVWTVTRFGQHTLRRQPQANAGSDEPHTGPAHVPYMPIVKVPYPSPTSSSRGDITSANHRAWFIVRLTDSADAHRLVRRWHNMYYDERQHGKRYLVEAEILY